MPDASVTCRVIDDGPGHGCADSAGDPGRQPIRLRPSGLRLGAAAPTAKKGYRPGSLEIFGAVLLLAIVFRGPLESLLGHPVMQSWSTVFVAICVQATPFLVLGVVVSGAIAAFVPGRGVHPDHAQQRRPGRAGRHASAARRCPAASAARCRSPTG